jgi:PEP-CTERM/exosortase A-associated glycosyltransferase
MRILHVLDHSIPQHSGYSFRTKAILEQQRALGWSTVQLTSSKHPGPPTREEEVDGFRFYRTPRSFSWLSQLPLLNPISVVNDLARRLDEVIEEVKPDVVHAHSPALNGLAALRVSQWHRLPVVYECRAFWEDAAVDHGTSSEGGFRYRATHALETYVFRRAQAITTICEGLRRDIIQRGIAPEKVDVIPNAVDIQRFRPTQARDGQLRDELGLTGATVLGFIGSFYAYEGLALLLRALPLIAQAQPDTRLLLVGGGSQEGELRSLMEQLRLDSRVIFTGRMSHEQVQKYYEQVDLLVYPRFSIRLTELVTPLKPLEAMAQGRPVLASDVGGHREIIHDGVNGWLFPAGDCEALADKVISLLSDRSSWPAVIREGRRLVEEDRNWAKSVARYAGVYEKAIRQLHVD